jgi:hypothetical protein
VTETAPPPVVRAAIGVWLAVGVFGLLNVLYLWLRRADLREVALRDGAATPGGVDQAISTLLLQLTVVGLVFTAAYAVLGVMLRRRRRWSRIALTVVAGLHLLWVVLPGVNAANLVTVLLIGTGFTLTWRPVTAHWVKEQ